MTLHQGGPPPVPQACGGRQRPHDHAEGAGGACAHARQHCRAQRVKQPLRMVGVAWGKFCCSHSRQGKPSCRTGNVQGLLLALSGLEELIVLNSALKGQNISE
eukprot:1161671-Pelagomonas_calceolata.AAC.16